MTDASANGLPFEPDPVFLHARREAVVILAAWLVALLWAVPYCYASGYGAVPAEGVATVFGVPSWVCWGVFAPWMAANLFTVWFCFVFMQDDELESAADRGGASPRLEGDKTEDRA